MNDQLVYITLAIVLALTFQPLKRVFDKATDRVFFRDRYDTQTVLNRLGGILTSERILDILLHDILTEICQNLRLSTGQCVILEDGKIAAVSHFGTEPKARDLTELEKLGLPILLAAQLEPSDARREIMRANDIQMSVPLRVHDQLIGYLLLGNKQSGSAYARQDQELLEIIAPSLAVSIDNAQAYARIARFNQTLQQEISQATHSLRLANENLRSVDKAKDEFLSIASHQLRTPLATIEGYLSVLTHGDVGEVAPRQQEILHSASAATTRMSALVTELLDISMLTAGRFVVRLEPADLVALIETEVKDLTGIAATKGLELRFQRPESPLPLIPLDASKIQQIVTNLIDNAIYYTPSGTVTVSVRALAGNARFTVTDTGIGVPQAEQGKLFSKFFRAGNARQIRPDGTGLGLFLAKQIIQAHKGTLIFKSIEGQGSTFGFEIPIQP